MKIAIICIGGAIASNADIVFVPLDVESNALIQHSGITADVGVSPAGWFLFGRGIVTSFNSTVSGDFIAVDSSTGSSFFQSEDFEPDTVTAGAVYWVSEGGNTNRPGSFSGGATAGLNYLLMDLDTNGSFETLLAVTLPEYPPEFQSLTIVGYWYESSGSISISDALTPQETSIELTRTDSNEIQISFIGTLMESSDLQEWSPVEPQPSSPLIIDLSVGGQSKFFSVDSPQ